MPTIQGIGLFKDSSKSIVGDVCKYTEGQGLVWKSENRGGSKGMY